MRLSSEMFGQILGDSVVYFTSDGGHRNARRAETSFKAMLSQHGVDCPVNVTEISTMGAGLLSENSMIVGEHVVLRCPCGEVVPLSIICAVRHCERDDDGFHVGVEYLRTI